MSEERKSTATPEQIAEFDALLAGLTPTEQNAVRLVWKAAQGFGYKNAAARVWALIPAPTATYDVTLPNGIRIVEPAAAAA